MEYFSDKESKSKSQTVDSVTPAAWGGIVALIQSLVNTVSQTQIEDIIRDLQDDDSSPGWDTGRSRYSYSWELEIERDYIRDHMEALGLDVRYQGFSLNGTPLDNIEGTLSGWGR